ncbi:MAG: YncE family protein [Chloroflexi bacterium]|nr:YncE family protein [Chloroflexota bacterium]MCI0647906.1 YncE family protein [Chloroflexota bacterium]MCI0727157.1 YncE family protein [Chloroflexota bacterium]
MKQIKRFLPYLLATTLAGLLLATVLLPVFQASAPLEAIGLDGTPHFLPAVRQDFTPTPPPSPTPPPIPQFVSNIPTTNAKCPGAAGFNPLSGYVYVLNDYSSNANIFQNRNFVGSVFIPPTIPDDPAGSWPVAIAADNDSTEVYVAAVHGGTARIDGLTLVEMGERYYEPHGVAVNPVNGLVYVPDLDRAIQVFDGSTLIENVVFAMDPQWDAWFLDVVVDPNTGYVYTAGAEGVMFVLNGTEVIGNYRLGTKVVDLEIDPIRGYIYAAHNEKEGPYQNNISVFNISTQTVTPLNTALRSRAIAVDPNTGLTYITNPGADNDPGDDSVTLLTGGVVYGNLPVGDLPWGVAVNPNTRYAFVTNRNDHDVTVFRDGVYVTTIPMQGIDPFAVAIDTNTNDTYVANRGIELSEPLFYCEAASVTILH